MNPKNPHQFHQSQHYCKQLFYHTINFKSPLSPSTSNNPPPIISISQCHLSSFTILHLRVSIVKCVSNSNFSTQLLTGGLMSHLSLGGGVLIVDFAEVKPHTPCSVLLGGIRRLHCFLLNRSFCQQNLLPGTGSWTRRTGTWTKLVSACPDRGERQSSAPGCLCIYQARSLWSSLFAELSWFSIS